MPECHFHFFNEQKQALGDLKNMKRGKNHLFLAKLRDRSPKMFQTFQQYIYCLTGIDWTSILEPKRVE